jgi:hypothetical protein
MRPLIPKTEMTNDLSTHFDLSIPSFLLLPSATIDIAVAKQVKLWNPLGGCYMFDEMAPKESEKGQG